MKEVRECPICFEPRAGCSGKDECSEHGVPYDVLAEWVNEQPQHVEECYHDQIPVLQIMLWDPSSFVARAKGSGRMNQRLTDTMALLARIEAELGSFYLRILQFLSSGYELAETDGEWRVQLSDGRIFSLREEEILELRQLGYIEGTRITELGWEAFRIYKTAHPLLWIDDFPKPGESK